MLHIDYTIGYHPKRTFPLSSLAALRVVDKCHTFKGMAMKHFKFESTAQNALAIASTKG
jgi:hypothetical protein